LQIDPPFCRNCEESTDNWVVNFYQCDGFLLSRYFYITPNVTVVNALHQKVPSFIVTLPNSRLDFGAIAPGETNTIYYSFIQADGRYSTMVTTSDGSTLRKTCGAVTKYKIHKRVIITYTGTQGITCTGT
tara:strand:- start:3193 stop:3582 length:390 start_codon:yes stop_codon:yes gene_type:complete